MLRNLFLALFQQPLFKSLLFKSGRWCFMGCCMFKNIESKTLDILSMGIETVRINFFTHTWLIE